MADNNNLKYEQINWGWLNDYAGYKFAPITFFDNLYTQDGKIFKTEYENTLDDLRTGKFVVGNAKALAVVNEDGTVSRINTSSTKPVYFNDGVPKQCSSISIDLTGNVNSGGTGEYTVKAKTFTGGSFSGTSVTASGKITGQTLEVKDSAIIPKITGNITIDGIVTVDSLKVSDANAIPAWTEPTKMVTLDGTDFKYSTLTNIINTNKISATITIEHGSENNRRITFEKNGSKITGIRSQILTTDPGHNLYLVSYNPTTDADWIALRIQNTGTGGEIRPIKYVGSTDTTSSGKNSGIKIYGAVWNDYAEYRDQWEDIEPGYCVCSSDNGKVFKTIEKFAPCDGIVSDTFGFAIGDNDICRTPLAVAGRVLAYCEGDRNDYHAGDTVCAGPNGKVIKMTREEIREYPDRIIGVVSEIPQYEIWENDIKVNGRIWVNVK